ncbi:MAG: DUF2283 domain-containing protein [Thermanaerothrix sp.]|nr:DUF2283 domain-containing protein [Thermanaerothrix sp.]
MMSLNRVDGVRKVLIASANPLFGRGLERLLHQQWKGRQFEVRVVATMEETLTLLESWLPDLVILDYDDEGNLISLEVLDASRRVTEARRIEYQAVG